MKKSSKLKFSAISVLLAALMIFSGCSSPSSSSKSSSSKAKGLITLNFLTYRSGQNVGAKYFLPCVERFNKEYDGKYKVVVQEIGQDSYDAKIKVLANANQLPTLMDGMHDVVWLKDYVAKNKLSLDLTDWLNQNPDIKKLCIADSLKYCTIDGRVVIFPLTISSPMGTFYNSSMYKTTKAIRDMSVSEFQASIGTNKLALMTGENAWTTALLYTDLIANQPGGVDLLKSHTDNKVTDFSSDIWINATTQLQSFLQKNASSNTLGAAYADADNNVLSKKSAIIFNGPWMFSDFKVASKDKWSNGFNGDDMVADIYPGNIAICNNAGFGGYWISNSASADQKEVALAFLKFINTPAEVESELFIAGGIAPNLTMSADYIAKTKADKLLSEYNNAFNSNTTYVPNFDDVVYTSVAQPGFPNILPKLMNGQLTPKAFCDQLTTLSKAAANQ